MYDSSKMFCQYLSRFQLDNFRGYLAHMEERFERDMKEFNEQLEAELNGKSEQERASIVDWYGKEIWNIAEIFPRHFWQSSLVTIWSHFEHEIVDLCRMDIVHEAEDIDTGTKRADKCKTLEDVRKYLDKRKVQLNSNWSELEKINKVRNQIVHDGGRRYIAGPEGYPDDEDGIKTLERSKAVDAYVAKREQAGKTGLSFESEELVVTAEFCRELAELCHVVADDTVSRMPPTEESYRQIEKLLKHHK